MKMKIFAIIFGLISLITISSAAVILKCTFIAGGFLEIGGVYYCDVSSLSVNSQYTNVTGATGTHLTRFNNDGVTGLSFGDCPSMLFLPSKIETIFKKLEAIQIYRTGLKRITKNDLKPFTKLRAFRICHSNIETLEKDLFIYNNQLEVIWLDNNKITHIDGNLLNSLPNLRDIDLRVNYCIDINAVTRGDVARVAIYFRSQCQDSDRVLMGKLEILVEQLSQLEAMRTELNKMSEHRNVIDTKLETLERNAADLQSENGICKCQLASIFMNLFDAKNLPQNDFCLKQ